MNNPGDGATRILRRQHWLQWFLTLLRWFLTLLSTVALGACLLPFIRSQPETVHAYFNALSNWQRISFGFALYVVFVFLTFKLFSPRLSHLLYARSQPPIWLACLLGIRCVAALDLKIGLSPRGYKATFWHWLGFGGAIVLVAAYRWLTDSSRASPQKPRQSVGDNATNLFDDWPSLEAWLRADAPAEHDFLGGHAVARRLKEKLDNGTRSIGIVGPFGAGKTSIVEWLDEMVKNDRGKTKPILFISRHSCWGFENSASAIHTMLADAIQQVGQYVDTFHISSLPEAYRQTFSAGGEWIDNVSKLMFGQRDPISQFRSLSDLLIDVNSGLVFVVEDLDRNTSRSFDIQEVLAFLQQLKAFPRLSFILTGGLTSSRSIDYAKLCDHIEYVKSVDANVASDFVERVRQHCLDTEIYSYVALSEPDTEHRWNPLSGLLLRDFQEYSLPQAVAQLLNTPRALRHALGRTFTTWHELHGEIDWDHLLAVNVLRFGAPECFLFLLRRWDRLRARPSDPKFAQDRIERIRESVVNDWSQTVQNVEWNPSAALEVMGCILPAAKWWLVDKSDTRDAPEPAQGVQYERYWRRAVNDVCDPSDVRDQVLIRAIRVWIESPREESELVRGICSNQAYSDLWEQLAGRYYANQPDLILLLCKHVLTHISRQHGTSASADSQGFGATFRFASRHLSLRAENQAWLEDRITDAAGISLELVNSLWYCCGTLRRSSILHRRIVKEFGHT